MIKFLSTPTNTMSGRAEVIRMFGGTVVGGLSVALNPSRSPYNFSWSARCCCRNNMILFSTLSCCQVYLPWERICLVPPTGEVYRGRKCVRCCFENLKSSMCIIIFFFTFSSCFVVSLLIMTNTSLKKKRKMRERGSVWTIGECFVEQ